MGATLLSAGLLVLIQRRKIPGPGQVLEVLATLAEQVPVLFNGGVQAAVGRRAVIGSLVATCVDDRDGRSVVFRPFIDEPRRGIVGDPESSAIGAHG